jgi:hypothetical protein
MLIPGTAIRQVTEPDLLWGIVLNVVRVNVVAAIKVLQESRNTKVKMEIFSFSLIGQNSASQVSIS